MARFIIIDNASGYIYGDTADFNGKFAQAQTDGGAPIDACRELDEEIIRVFGRTYENVSSLASNETGYLVYRADINGSDAVATVEDGQSQEMIAAVVASCPLVATIRCVSVEA